MLPTKDDLKRSLEAESVKKLEDTNREIAVDDGNLDAVNLATEDSAPQSQYNNYEEENFDTTLSEYNYPATGLLSELDQYDTILDHLISNAVDSRGLLKFENFSNTSDLTDTIHNVNDLNDNENNDMHPIQSFSNLEDQENLDNESISNIIADDRLRIKKDSDDGVINDSNPPVSVLISVPNVKDQMGPSNIICFQAVTSSPVSEDSPNTENQYATNDEISRAYENDITLDNMNQQPANNFFPIEYRSENRENYKWPVQDTEVNNNINVENNDAIIADSTNLPSAAPMAVEGERYFIVPEANSRALHLRDNSKVQNTIITNNIAGASSTSQKNNIETSYPKAETESNSLINNGLDLGNIVYSNGGGASRTISEPTYTTDTTKYYEIYNNQGNSQGQTTNFFIERTLDSKNSGTDQTSYSNADMLQNLELDDIEDKFKDKSSEAVQKRDIAVYPNIITGGTLSPSFLGLNTAPTLSCQSNSSTLLPNIPNNILTDHAMMASLGASVYSRMQEAESNKNEAGNNRSESSYVPQLVKDFRETNTNNLNPINDLQSYSGVDVNKRYSILLYYHYVVILKYQN